MHLKAIVLVAGCLAAEGLVAAAPGKYLSILLIIHSYLILTLMLFS